MLFETPLLPNNRGRFRVVATTVEPGVSPDFFWGTSVTTVIAFRCNDYARHQIRRFRPNLPTIPAWIEASHPERLTIAIRTRIKRDNR